MFLTTFLATIATTLHGQMCRIRAMHIVSTIKERYTGKYHEFVAPWVTMPMPTNKWYLFSGIACYCGDNDFTFDFIARSDVNTWLVLPDMDSHMTCNKKVFFTNCAQVPSPWDSHTFAVRHWECWLPVNTGIEKWAQVTISLFFYQWKLPAFHSKATFTCMEFHESILTSMSGDLAFSYCSSCKDLTAPRQHTKSTQDS